MRSHSPALRNPLAIVRELASYSFPLCYNSTLFAHSEGEVDTVVVQLLTFSPVPYIHVKEYKLKVESIPAPLTLHRTMSQFGQENAEEVIFSHPTFKSNDSFNFLLKPWAIMQDFK